MKFGKVANSYSIHDMKEALILLTKTIIEIQRNKIHFSNLQMTMTHKKLHSTPK